MSSTDPVASTVQALSRLGALRDPAAW